MSLQDDYFDLESRLKGENKEKFIRIWNAFVDMENEYQDLLEIKNSVKRMAKLAFKDEEINE